MPLPRTLVVDDEPVARQILRELLAGSAEVVGEASTGLEALAAIERLHPDLVFLDLQMPEGGGFEVIRNLPPNPPAVVIVTAFDQHAIEAFDAGAVDYLLKPVHPERLEKCLERVRSRRPAESPVARVVEKLADAPTRILAKRGEEYHLLSPADVFAFQAERELVWIHTAKQRLLATYPLKLIERRLKGSHFARIHRGALVNLDHVSKMSPLSSQRWQLTLTNGLEFAVSKRQAAAVRALLGW